MIRSYLFVPADSEKKILKALDCDADALIFDLEDAVHPSAKDVARQTLRTLAQDIDFSSHPKTLYLRINGLDTPFWPDDVVLCAELGFAGVVLPKAEGAASVFTLSAELAVQENAFRRPIDGTRILAIVTETARAVFLTGDYATHSGVPCSSRLMGLTWGGEDLSAAVGALSNRDDHGFYTQPYQLARSLTLFGAAAAGVDAIDAVYPNFRDLDGLRAECQSALRDGFVGKMAIHPQQVETIHAVFTPTADMVSEAKAIVQAFEEAGDVGVVGYHGRMLDRPHLVNSQKLLKRAAFLGLS